MANNLQAVIPQLLAQGLEALKPRFSMSRYVQRAYDREAGQLGSSIDVPIDSSMIATPVVAGVNYQAGQDAVPQIATIQLDQWKEAKFDLSDKDMLEVMAGYMPLRAQSAINAIATDVNSYLFNLYKEVPTYVGTAGTTPFTTNTDAARAARRALLKQLCPDNPLYMAIDPDAEFAATGLQNFLDASQAGSDNVIVDGVIGRKLGFNWLTDTQVATHTSTPFTSGAVTVNGAQAVGNGSTDGGRTGFVSIAKLTNASPLVKGDILQFAGDPNSYAVMSDVSLIVGNTLVAITPALKVAKSGGEAVTKVASHVANLAFHPSAIAFASRPLPTDMSGQLGRLQSSITDPDSALTLRLSITGLNKTTQFSFDILYGAKLLRQDCAVRVLG